MQIKFRKQYTPFLMLSILALLASMWAGLIRLGWSLPALLKPLPMGHGPLMVSGFLGSLIILERVVALCRRWLLSVPLLCGLGWLTLLVFPDTLFGALLFTLGSLGGVLVLVLIVRREPAVYTAVMLVGMLAWFTGNLLWLAGEAIFQIVFWWQAFLVLTILGERLELSRVLHPTKTQIRLFLAAAMIFLAGVILNAFQPDWGARLIGLGLLSLALWCFRNDIATRNRRHPAPLTRYIARALMLGYIWLALAGILDLWLGAQYAGPYYDAVLHMVFIGFIISMIFGHAPIILPAILNVPVTFRPAFYLHLGLLHLSLGLRVVSDLSVWVVGRKWGGLLNEVAILLFLILTLLSIRAEVKRIQGESRPV
jgi:hypothetical protein